MGNSVPSCKEPLRENLNTDDTLETLKRAACVIKGWVNYHNISDNYKRVHSFVHHSRAIIFKWFNRKGGQRKMTWKHCNKILEAIGLSQFCKTKSMFVSTLKSWGGMTYREPDAVSASPDLRRGWLE
ncbi:MAG: hypothetical protein H0U70_09280 [Tatlockia sp.]|nr:hypothetical protein [Tatlockia sp.]